MQVSFSRAQEWRVPALARGARQFVVQLALETMSCLLGSYNSSLTPMTNIWASLEGAEMMTFLTPCFMCSDACRGHNLSLPTSVSSPNCK